jgi:endo-1,4-beta-xylanase
MHSETEITRRQVLGAALGEAGIANAPIGRFGSASLQKAAAQAGLRFGSESDADFKAAAPGYSNLFIRHCDLFAPQTPWSQTGRLRFAAEPQWQDPNILFAREHGMQLTGGHLLWHNSTPRWLEHLPTQSAAEKAVADHIAAMTERYGSAAYAWNVVNEAIDPRDGRPDGLRNSQLLRTLGPDFIASAFVTARQSAPHALLVYNDYGFEFARPDEEARRTALLRLLDRLQSVRAPIDAVGLQSHLRLGGVTFDPEIYRKFLREIAGRGLAIIISELDVLDVEFTPSIASRDADVAALYGAFLDAALDERAVAAVVAWGLVDGYSWLNLQHLPGFARWDRQPVRPLLFDNALRPKPAFDAVFAALRNAPPRRNDQSN